MTSNQINANMIRNQHEINTISMGNGYGLQRNRCDIKSLISYKKASIMDQPTPKSKASRHMWAPDAQWLDGKGMWSPIQSVLYGPSNMLLATCSMGPRIVSMDHRACAMDKRPCSMGHRPCSMVHSSCSMFHSACCMVHRAFDMVKWRCSTVPRTVIWLIERVLRRVDLVPRSSVHTT